VRVDDTNSAIDVDLRSLSNEQGNLADAVAERRGQPATKMSAPRDTPRNTHRDGVL
jgi:hypothetical protein